MQNFSLSVPVMLQSINHRFVPDHDSMLNCEYWFIGKQVTKKLTSFGITWSTISAKVRSSAISFSFFLLTERAPDCKLAMTSSIFPIGISFLKIFWRFKILKFLPIWQYYLLQSAQTNSTISIVYQSSTVWADYTELEKTWKKQTLSALSFCGRSF